MIVQLFPFPPVVRPGREGTFWEHSELYPPALAVGQNVFICAHLNGPGDPSPLVSEKRTLGEQRMGEEQNAEN